MSDPFVNPNEAEALASEVARISKLELLFAPERETLADAADTIRSVYRLLALCRDTPRAEDEERIGELEAALSDDMPWARAEHWKERAENAISRLEILAGSLNRICEACDTLWHESQEGGRIIHDAGIMQDAVQRIRAAMQPVSRREPVGSFSDRPAANLAGPEGDTRPDYMLAPVQRASGIMYQVRDKHGEICGTYADRVNAELALTQLRQIEVVPEDMWVCEACDAPTFPGVLVCDKCKPSRL